MRTRIDECHLNLHHGARSCGKRHLVTHRDQPTARKSAERRQNLSQSPATVRSAMKNYGLQICYEPRYGAALDLKFASVVLLLPKVLQRRSSKVFGQSTRTPRSTCMTSCRCHLVCKYNSCQVGTTRYENRTRSREVL